MAALAQSNVTTSLPGDLVLGKQTETAPITSEYRQIGTYAPAARTEASTSEPPQIRSIGPAEAPPSAAVAKYQSVKGVVDHVEGDRARVTLFYAGRSNDFVLDTNDLSNAGAGYPGALFEIVVRSDLGYSIVHSVEEEAAARRGAPPPDLAFLDE
jgi:hypothetical protein